MASSKFMFDEDFAGNFVAGQVVDCEIRDDGTTLVDSVAIVNTVALLEYGHYIDKSAQSTNLKESFKSEALNLWQRVCESEMTYDDSMEVISYISTLFMDIN